MGVQGGAKFFGVVFRKNPADLTELLNGKKAAIEAYGWLHELVIQHLRSPERSAKLACHLWASHQLQYEDIAFLVDNFVEEVLWMRSFFSAGFVVVFEGSSYQAKHIVSTARRQVGQKAYAEEKYLRSLTIPDCLTKLIMERLTKADIHWIAPPAEADSQLAYLQVTYLFTDLFALPEPLIGRPTISWIIFLFPPTTRIFVFILGSQTSSTKFSTTNPLVVSTLSVEFL